MQGEHVWSYSCCYSFRNIALLNEKQQQPIRSYELSASSEAISSPLCCVVKYPGGYVRRVYRRYIYVETALGTENARHSSSTAESVAVVVMEDWRERGRGRVSGVAVLAHDTRREKQNSWYVFFEVGRLSTARDDSL